MKRSIFALAVLMLVGLLTSPVLAQGDEIGKVTETFLDWIAARNAGDADAIARHWLREFSYFPETGDLMGGGSLSLQELTEAIQSGFKSGRRDDIQVRHLEVKVFGNVALITCYLSGWLSTGTEIRQGPWRMSSIWNQEGSRWKQAHFHVSPVTGSSLVK